MSKRIIIVSNSSSNLVNFRGKLIERLIDEKSEVLVITPKIDFTTDYQRVISKLGASTLNIPLDRTGLNPFRDFKTYLSLKYIFTKFKPDIVLSYTAKPIIYSGLAIGRNSKINFFPNLTGLGYGFTDQSIKRKLINFILRKLYKLSLKSSTAIIFQNPEDKLLFEKLNLTTIRKLLL